MAGPRYTIAQTRARIAALTLAADHLDAATKRDEIDEKQYADVATKLRNEATRLALKRNDWTENGQLLHEKRRTETNARRMFSAPTPTAEGNNNRVG